MSCDIHTMVEIKEGNKWTGLTICPDEFSTRNYALFAFLAGVRNSFNTKGFEPKGLPDDISDKNFCSSNDYHSHSFLTLKELVDSDKSDYFSHKCRVVSSFWEKFKELGGVLPEGMDVEEDFKVSSIIDALALSLCPEVIIKWVLSEEEQKQTTLYKGIEALKEIAGRREITDFSKIRIVFAFDN